jgi:dTDP-3,4-didehydro-2,6-dideoxy-alpha-D-glucose 3-reductase
MKILFIGYSNLLKNRIIPILDRINFIDSLCIAKYVHQPWDESYKVIFKPVELFNDYKHAIFESNASIAYISTTNNSHYIWAKETLKAGMHTIIDKPATINLFETEELINIAKKSHLLLSESTVYTYHPQFDLINNIFEKEQSNPKLLTAFFSFPLIDENNFRYKKELGGGAFLDTCPYAVSIGRYFFKEIPQQSFYLENSALLDGLETSYSLLLKYSNGRSLIGHFGFNTEYVNRLSLLGERVIADIDRVFTIPDSLSNPIKIRANNQSYEVISPCGNTFELYLNTIAKCIKNEDFDGLYNDMLMDALSRDLINNEKYKLRNDN